MKSFQVELSPAIPLHRQIERTLRGRIESGELPAGKPLPNTREMARQMGVHPLTLQKALRRLKNDGLIDRTPRLGSFVRGAAQAPAIALIIGPSLTLECAHFHRALARMLQAETSERWAPRLYDGLPTEASPEANAANKPFLALKRDCDHLPFTGVIAVGFGYQPWTAIEALRRLPYAWMGIASFESDLAFDHAHFAREAAAHFAGQGRRHVAYLRTFSHWSWSRGDRETFAAAAAAGGIGRTQIHDLDDLGQQGIFDEYVAYTRVSAIVKEWCRTGWPDAVVVTDDVVTRSVALALLHVNQPGARRPALLTWANDSTRFAYGLPVARYEIPVAFCARRLKAILDRRMDGKALPEGQELVRGRITEAE